MSFRVVADVYDFGPPDPIDTAILVCLASFASDEGQQCFPSVARIARMTRVCERTVIRAIAQLETDGWLTVRRGCGRGHRSQYTINVEELKRRQRVTLLADAATAERVTLRTVKGDFDDNPPAPPNRKKGQERSVKKQYPPTPLAEGGARENEPEAASEPRRENGHADAGTAAGDGAEKGAAGWNPEAPTGAGHGRVAHSHDSAQAGAHAPKSAADRLRPEVRTAAERVMRECGMSSRRLLPVILAAIEQRLADRTAEEVAAVMLENWREYQRAGPYLRFVWSPRKWFAEGHWRNWELWPIDRKAMEAARRF